MMGTNTHTVVSVEAVTAIPTILVPLSEASAVDIPSFRNRSILSRTTIELSTSIPMPSASPPRDIILSDTSKLYIRKNVAITDIGMERPTISVLFRFRRNRYRIIIASTPPK